jgi:hypothetical protein
MTGDAGTPDNNENWTPWTAAYAYAPVMRDIATAYFNRGGKNFTEKLERDYWDVPMMLVAYVLATYAAEKGIIATQPMDLADISAADVHDLLEPRVLLRLLSTPRLVTPAAGEPGYKQFNRMTAEIDSARTSWKNSAWSERGTDAKAMVAGTIMALTDQAERDRGPIPLRIIADRAEGNGDTSTENLPLHGEEPPPYQLSEYMAPDKPVPERSRDEKKWAARVLEGSLGGKMLLLDYLSSVDDANLDVPNELVASRQAGESDEKYDQRQRLAKLFVEVKVHTADWAPNVTDELLHIRPSDAGHAVEAIVDEAKKWWDAARFSGTIGDLLPAMTALLDALVAPERRADVESTLLMVASDPLLPLTRARYRIRGAADSRPFEALHLAAALAAALYQIPACVPDRKAAFMQLTTDALDLANGNVKALRERQTRQPSQFASLFEQSEKAAPSPADVRKKAARKAAQKSRRKGRRGR